LVARDPKLWLSRSWTTRARREGEAEDAYTFVDRPTFEAGIAAGRFLEHASVLGELYGTPVPEAPPGHDIVLEIDVQGAEQVRKRCENVVCVLLVPPSRAEQAQRMGERGDSEAHVRARLELAERETAAGRAFVDAIVVNWDVDQAVDELAGILDRARRGAS
jgi:guanylate kinase